MKNVLVWGMLGVTFFVLHFALRHYCSKGFALFPFKHGVKIAAIEGVTPSIDHHNVPKGRGCPCRDPGTGGGVPEPTRHVRGSKNRFRMKITVHFGRYPRSSPTIQERVCHTLHHQI